MTMYYKYIKAKSSWTPSEKRGRLASKAKEVRGRKKQHLYQKKLPSPPQAPSVSRMADSSLPEGAHASPDSFVAKYVCVFFKFSIKKRFL